MTTLAELLPATPITDAKACGSCASNGCQTVQLTMLGGKTLEADATVALMGNPNTGKSTLFNAWTGLRQHVGNWNGKTVSRAEGALKYNSRTYKIIDLPGTYSLLSTSVHEEIARDYLLFGQPDAVVIVADASRLERSLHLILQTLEITDRVVVCLNLMDEARRNGLTLDVRALARELGVPVVPTAVRRGEGVSELLGVTDEMARGLVPGKPRYAPVADAQLNAALNALVEQLETAFPNLSHARWIAMRLLEGDETIIRAVREGTLGDLRQAEQALSLPLALEAR